MMDTEQGRGSEKISIIGAGAWGTTLSILLAENKHEVTLWAYEKELINDIREFRENKLYLPGYQLPASISITNNLEETLNSKYILLVAPSQFLRGILKKLKNKIAKESVLICATKGLEENTHKTMSKIIKEELPRNPLVILSGPNLSKEIAEGLPAATVVASENLETAKKAQELIMSPRLRVYTNTDVKGVELGGSLKNIIALAAGISDGLELGNNAKSALLIRGIAEITRLGVALGAKEQTFAGLSGMGDLITTCSSPLSRNHQVGVQIAKGKKLKELLSSMKQVAEGVKTTAAAVELAKKKKVEIPITEQVYEVLFKNKDPFAAISSLLTRKAKKE